MKLYCHPEIKEFLSFYKTSDRNEVLKLSVLYTIYSLRSNYTCYPSVQDLQGILLNAGKLKSLESTISEMKQKLDMIKQEIGGLESSLTKTSKQKVTQVEPIQRLPKEVVSVLKPTSFQPISFQGKRSFSAPHITKAPSLWRQGDQSVFRNNFAENKPNSRNFLFRDTSPPNFRGHNYNISVQVSNYNNRKYPDRG